MKYKQRLLAYQQDFSHHISIFCEHYDEGKRMVAKPIEYKETQDGEYLDSMIDISYETGQALMDSLWQCGLRPKEGMASVGQLAATNKHLQDMRTIVEAKLKVELK